MKILRSLLTVVLVLTLLAIPRAIAENRHGDPGQAGRANFIGSNPMTAQWEVDIKPTVRDKMVASNGLQTLVISNKNSVICVDTSTGKPTWDKELKTPSTISNSPAITDKIGVVTCDGGYVITYDLMRGCELFRLVTGWEQMTSPVIGEAHILVKGTNKNRTKGGLLAVSPVTGKVSWGLACASSLQPPSIGSGRVFVSTPDAGEFVALDELDGAVKWNSRVEKEITFISTRFDIVAVTTENSISIFSSKDGSFVWSRAFDEKIKWSPTISKDIIFISTDDGKILHALKMSDGETIWEKTLPSKSRQPLVDRERVILTLERSVKICDQKTGEKLWSIDTVGSTVGNTTAVMDNMMIATSLSKIISLRTAGYEITSGIDSVDLGTVTFDDTYIYNSDLIISNCSIDERQIMATSNSPWLTVSPDNFKIPGGTDLSLVITAELEDYPSGEHSALVTVSWDYGELVIPVSVKKVIKIQPLPKPGMLTVSNTYFEVTGALNHPVSSKILTIKNIGESSATFTLSTLSDWILLSNNFGELSPGRLIETGITCLPGLAVQGENHGIITLSSSTGQKIPIELKFTRIPGTEKIIIEVSEGRNWIKINEIRVRSRPAPVLESGEILIPLNLLTIALDATCSRWKGNPSAPCKTEFNLISRGGMSVGNCVGSDMLKIEVEDDEKYVQMACFSRITGGHVLLPIHPFLLAFDKIASTRIEGDIVFYEVNFPEIFD